jgi:hypothetical protein
MTYHPEAVIWGQAPQIYILKLMTQVAHRSILRAHATKKLPTHPQIFLFFKKKRLFKLLSVTVIKS